MKYYLSSFGLHNPYIEVDYADHLIYPVTSEYEYGLDLDYGMLMVGEAFVMDEAAYHFILADKRPFISAMAYSLKALKEEGLLKLINQGLLLNNNKAVLLEKTEYLANDYKNWIGIVRLHWKELQKNRNNFVNKFGSPGKEIINSNHFTLVNAVKKITGRIDPLTIDKYSSSIFSNKKRFTADEKEVMIEMIKPLIFHILASDLTRHDTGTVILDWNDSKRYYQHVAIQTWGRDKTEELIPIKSGKIFSLLLPQVKANKIAELIKFINTETAVKSLRFEIIRTIMENEEVNKKWLMDFQDQLIKANLKMEKVMKRVRWGTALIGFFLPGGQEIIVEGVKREIESIAEKSYTNKNFKWYYAFQENITSA